MFSAEHVGGRRSDRSTNNRPSQPRADRDRAFQALNVLTVRSRRHAAHGACALCTSAHRSARQRPRVSARAGGQAAGKASPGEDWGGLGGGVASNPPGRRAGQPRERQGRGGWERVGGWGGQQAPWPARGPAQRKSYPWEEGRGGWPAAKDGSPERQGGTINVSCSIDEIENVIITGGLPDTGMISCAFGEVMQK